MVYMLYVPNFCRHSHGWPWLCCTNCWWPLLLDIQILLSSLPKIAFVVGRMWAGDPSKEHSHDWSRCRRCKYISIYCWRGLGLRYPACGSDQHRLGWIIQSNKCTDLVSFSSKRTLNLRHKISCSGIYCALLFFHAILASLATKVISRLQWAYITLNLVWVSEDSISAENWPVMEVSFRPSLPIATPREFVNSASFAFGDFENSTFK